MVGALVMVFVLVVVLPVAVLLGGMVAAAVLGSIVKADGDANAASAELVELNR